MGTRQESGPQPYDIHTDIRFGALERIDVQAIADACVERWWNQSLCLVNDSVVRLGVLCGEFHWHVHDREDEFFYVVEGRLLVDLEEPVDGRQETRTIELGSGQGVTVPHGVPHRTRAPERTVVLMIEPATVAPTGDG